MGTREYNSMRFRKLSEALELTNSDSGNYNYFTAEERMLINQERAYLLNQTNEEPTIRFYEIPEKLENKINNLLKQ